MRSQIVPNCVPRSTPKALSKTSSGLCIRPTLIAPGLRRGESFESDQLARDCFGQKTGVHAGQASLNPALEISVTFIIWVAGLTLERSDEGGQTVSLFNLQELLLEKLNPIRLRLRETRLLRPCARARSSFSPAAKAAYETRTSSARSSILRTRVSANLR